jgi:hypothetical protein
MQIITESLMLPTPTIYIYIYIYIILYLHLILYLHREVCFAIHAEPFTNRSASATVRWRRQTTTTPSLAAPACPQRGVAIADDAFLYIFIYIHTLSSIHALYVYHPFQCIVPQKQKQTKKQTMCKHTCTIYYPHFQYVVSSIMYKRACPVYILASFPLYSHQISCINLHALYIYHHFQNIVTKYRV